MAKLLTVEELAQELRVTTGTIRNRLSRGDDLPPSIRVGRRRLFPSAELEKWLAAMIEHDSKSSSDGTNAQCNTGRPRITKPGTRSQLDLLGNKK